jgi:hypothetical protein
MNLATRGDVNVELIANRGPLDAVGGLSRPDTVLNATTTIRSPRESLQKGGVTPRLGAYPSASSRPATRTRCVRVRKTTGSGLREKPLRPTARASVSGAGLPLSTLLPRSSTTTKRSILPPPAEFFEHGS